MVRHKLEMHQNWKSLLMILKTMLVEHKHSFLKEDLKILSERNKDIRFYDSVLHKKYIPHRILNLIQLEKEDSLYYLSTMLDKYSLDENNLQKLIIEFEKLKKLISS